MKKIRKIAYTTSMLLCMFFNGVYPDYPNQRFVETPDDSFMTENNFAYDFTNDSTLESFLDHSDNAGLTITRNANPVDILSNLNIINAIPIIQQNLYIKSNSLHTRSILDSPLFEPHFSFYSDDTVFGLHIFYNQKKDACYTKNNHSLESYIALSKPTLIDALENSVTSIKELLGTDELNFNIKKIFNAAKKITIEERQLGGMFYIKKRWRCFNLLTLLPLYYREKNFQLNKQEKKIIEGEFNTSDPSFIRKHLVSDALGLGDMRIELDGTVYQKPTIEFRVGLETTLPTACAFKKGLYGNSFAKRSSQATFDINTLFDLVSDGIQSGDAQKAFAFITNFAKDSLDRLSANLLDPALGNGGHVGIGLVLRNQTQLNFFFKRSWAENFNLNNRASFEYLVGKEQKRLFIKFANPLEFERRDFNTMDELLAQEYITFLEQQFSNQFCPPFLESFVRPGFIIRSTNSLSYFPHRFGVTLTSDWWYQKNESLSLDQIDADSATRTSIKIKTARQSSAYQWKLATSLLYKLETSQRDWVFSAHGDYTVCQYGIGKDWSLGLNVEVHF